MSDSYFVSFVDSQPQLTRWHPFSLSFLGLLPGRVADIRAHLNPLRPHPVSYYREVCGRR